MFRAVPLPIIRSFPLYIRHCYISWRFDDSFRARLGLGGGIKTHFVFNLFFFENRAVYEIMWKNIVERGRLQMTIWRTRIVCWITKATHTQSLEYVKLIAFPLQQWSCERAPMLRYTHIACLAQWKLCKMLLRLHLLEKFLYVSNYKCSMQGGGGKLDRNVPNYVLF